MNMEVEYLKISNDRCPYLEWENSLDRTARSVVRTRINRLRMGVFGNCSSIKGEPGLFELKIHLGPGYRLYLGKVKDALVLLLCGGDKKTQNRDIERAKDYWRLYNKSRKEK